MANIFPTDFEEKLTMAAGDYILFSDSEDGNKLKKAQYSNLKGEQGDAATITVGSVTTGAAGSSASVVNTGTTSAAVLDFTIPQGDKGDTGNPGSAATITVGTTTTGAAGTNASVTNSGTSSAAVLNFTIPKGADGETANVKEFTLSNTSDLTNGQKAYDYYVAGNYPIIRLSGKLYYPYSSSSSAMFWEVPFEKTVDNSSSTGLQRDGINMTLSSGTVTALTTTTIFINNGNFLRTGKDYPTPYTPEYNGSPATKKYVDDKSTVVSSSTPSNPTEGMLWYDTTNDVLKAYDGSQWNECGSGGGGGSDIVYATQAEYNALLPGALTDGKNYVIYEKSWSPGVNTMAYYPLDSTNTVNDLSGNSKTLTNTGGVTFGTYQGVDCANMPGTAFLKNTSSYGLTSGGNFTASIWCYWELNISGGLHIWSQPRFYGDGDGSIGIWISPDDRLIGYNPKGSQTTTTISNTAWQLLTVTFDGTNTKLYVNGVNVDTTAKSGYTYTDSGLGIGGYIPTPQYWKGGLSEFIMENKARTAEEVSTYFNNNKAIYGIS